ncbi:hypothetical protein [Bacillus thuringiensis]|uniref:hypothetical protein n=1 Tax=Bacillus thuringiensis TaxID=1428 RepID=UPI003458D41E
MTNLSFCSSSDAGTFSTASQTALATNTVINLTQQVLVGTSISFTSPNTINLKPGSYIVRYSLLGLPINSGALIAVGLRLNGVIITQTSIAYSSNGNGSAYPEATGAYLITINTNSTLQLVARTPVTYPIATINAVLTANNVQTAQLTIFKIKG